MITKYIDLRAGCPPIFASHKKDFRPLLLACRRGGGEEKEMASERDRLSGDNLIRLISFDFRPHERRRHGRSAVDRLSDRDWGE